MPPWRSCANLSGTGTVCSPPPSPPRIRKYHPFSLAPLRCLSPVGRSGGGDTRISPPSQPASEKKTSRVTHGEEGIYFDLDQTYAVPPTEGRKKTRVRDSKSADPLSLALFSQMPVQSPSGGEHRYLLILASTVFATAAGSQIKTPPSTQSRGGYLQRE